VVSVYAPSVHVVLSSALTICFGIQ